MSMINYYCMICKKGFLSNEIEARCPNCMLSISVLRASRESIVGRKDIDQYYDNKRYTRPSAHRQERNSKKAKRIINKFTK